MRALCEEGCAGVGRAVENHVFPTPSPPLTTGLLSNTLERSNSWGGYGSVESSMEAARDMRKRRGGMQGQLAIKSKATSRKGGTANTHAENVTTIKWVSESERARLV